MEGRPPPWPPSALVAPRPLAPLLGANPALIHVSLMRYALIDTLTSARLPPHVWPIAPIRASAAAAAGYAFFWSSEEEYGRD